MQVTLGVCPNLDAKDLEAAASRCELFFAAHEKLLWEIIRRRTFFVREVFRPSEFYSGLERESGWNSERELKRNYFLKNVVGDACE